MGGSPCAGRDGLHDGHKLSTSPLQSVGSSLHFLPAAHWPYLLFMGLK